MKAKLVYVSLATRVIVKDNATEEEILREAKENFLYKFGLNGGHEDWQESVEEIIDDEEVPYNKEEDYPQTN